MALEQNNQALQFEPGFDPEFERIMQRHLKHGGAPVAACMGFDADTASAFLEDALAASARSGYESHLAGCPACRRHVIELSRLIQLIPQLEASPSSAQPVWANWKTAIAGWFDFSEWQWNWQTAGLASAAMAVLVAAAVIRPWQQAPRRDAAAIAPAAITLGQAADPTASEDPSASAPSSPASLTGGLESARELAEQPLGKAAVNNSSIPSPDFRARQDAQTVASNLPAGSAAGESRISFQSSLLGQSSLSSGNFTPPSAQPVNVSQVNASVQDSPVQDSPVQGSPVRDSVVASRQAPEPPAESDVAAKDSAEASSRLGLSSDDNPMRRDSAKPAGPEGNGPRSEPKAKAGWIDRAMGFVPLRKGDRDAKAGPVIRNEEENRFLLVRIHNRVFRFENGAWVDQEYKEDLMKWRVTKLVRGSEEFNQVLAGEPQLKPYFAKAPILVIWRDKIYKVVAK